MTSELTVKFDGGSMAVLGPDRTIVGYIGEWLARHNELIKAPAEAEAAELRTLVERIHEHHADVHQCGGRWWNPTGKPGAASAQQRPCPTLELIQAHDRDTEAGK